jgi:ribosomal protein S18 acetylase RimI-like enzyme
MPLPAKPMPTLGSDTAVALRPAVPEDRPFLFAVYAGTRQEELAVLPWDAAQKDAFLQMQFHAQDTYYRQVYPDAAYLVILHGGEPAGRLYVHRAERELRIIDIALLPEFRGRGLGTGLLRDLLAEGAARRVPVSIYVEQFNPAQRLYRRLGFVTAGQTGIYLLMEWHPPGPTPDA